MSDQIGLSVEVVPQIVGSPYYGLAVRAHAALLEDGFVDERASLISDGTGAVVASTPDSAVGVLTFHKWYQELTIGIAYVVPEYRRRGIFRFMFMELVKEAERQRCSRISSVTLLCNTTYQRAAVAVGQRATATVFELDLAIE